MTKFIKGMIEMFDKEDIQIMKARQELGDIVEKSKVDFTKEYKSTVADFKEAHPQEYEALVDQIRHKEHGITMGELAYQVNLRRKLISQ